MTFHPIIDEIKKINFKKMLFKGELEPLVEYREQILEIINTTLIEITPGAELDKDIETLYQWFKYRDKARYWQQAKQTLSSEDMAVWIMENAIVDLRDSLAEDSFLKAAGVPSESEIEDANTLIESIQFVGSDAQIKFARDIAQRSIYQVALAMRNENFKIPREAKLWIQNQNSLEDLLKLD